MRWIPMLMLVAAAAACVAGCGQGSSGGDTKSYDFTVVYFGNSG